MTESLRKFSRELPVTLNDGELQAYGRLLADKIHAVELKEDAKKQEMARRGAEIKTYNQEIKRLADARLKGEEVRPVQCEERLHGNVIEVFRLDLGTVVDSRPAGMQDLQTTMPFASSNGTDGFDEGPRGDQLGNDQPEWRQPDNVLPFTGTDVESSTGDTVHVGDANDRDEETASEFEDDEPQGFKVDGDDEESDDSEEPSDDEIEGDAEPTASKITAPRKVARDRSAKVLSNAKNKAKSKKR